MARTKRSKPEAEKGPHRKTPKKATPRPDGNQPTLTQMVREASGVTSSVAMKYRNNDDCVIEVDSVDDIIQNPSRGGALVEHILPLQPAVEPFPQEPTSASAEQEGILPKADTTSKSDDDEYGDEIFKSYSFTKEVVEFCEHAENEHQRKSIGGDSSLGAEGVTRENNKSTMYASGQSTQSVSLQPSEGSNNDAVDIRPCEGMEVDVSEFEPQNPLEQRKRTVESSDEADDDASTCSDYSEESWAQRREFRDTEQEESDGVWDEVDDESDEVTDFIKSLTQVYDQEDVCDYAARNEAILSQEASQNTQVQDGDETALLAQHQTCVADFFPNGDPGVAARSPKSVTIRDSFPRVERTFTVGKTYGVKATVAEKHAKLRPYYFTVLGFQSLPGCLLGAKYEPRSGVSIDSSGTFLGEQQAKKLAKSRLFKNIPRGDRYKVIQINGCSYLKEGEPVRLGLLDNQPKPKPNPSLFYEVHGKSNNDFHVAYFFYRSREWAYRKYEGQIRALDLFSGVGGMALGLEMAGIRVTHAVDIRRGIMECLGQYIRKHFREKGELDADVFYESVHSFLEKAQTIFNHYVEPKGAAARYAQPGDIDHIHSSSPCQGFSLANINGSGRDEANNILIFVIILYVRFYRPKTATFENVLGLLTKKNRHYLQKLKRLFIVEGYQVRTVTMNASHYGDPQHRLRVILFAARDDHKLPDVPKPTHGPGTYQDYATVRQALTGLEDIQPTISSGSVLIDKGTKEVFDHCKDTRNFRLGDTKMKKLSGDCPAWTILCQRPVEHPIHDRLITERERARLQSFPDDFPFHLRTQHDVRNAIGNAVPVKLATAISKAVQDSYNYHLKPGVVCYFSKEREKIDRNRDKGLIDPLTQSCLLPKTK